MKSLNFFSFIILFLLFKLANAEEASYLLQSIEDPNKVELLTNHSKLNILYINPKCSTCFGNAEALLKKNNSKFIIIVGQKPIYKLTLTLNKMKVPKRLWSSIFLDPALRFTRSNKILDKTSVAIAYRNGKTLISQDILLSTRLPTEKELSVWKSP